MTLLSCKSTIETKLCFRQLYIFSLHGLEVNATPLQMHDKKIKRSESISVWLRCPQIFMYWKIYAEMVELRWLKLPTVCAKNIL